MRGLRSLPVWIAGAAVGIAAEWRLYGWDDPRQWVPDLAAGWSLIACGLLASARRPESRSGALMTATGFLWFAGNFASSDVAWIAWLSTHGRYLYRGPLVHLILTYPRGRSAPRLDRIAVAIGYAAAVVTPVWRSHEASIALAGCLVAVVTIGYARSIGRERRERLAAWAATTFVAAVTAATAIARLVDPSAAEATLLLQQLALCALSLALLAGLVAEPWAQAGMTDLVVELGESRSGTLRPALARALGDPTLELGYWSPEAGGYVDDAGRELELPAPGSGRSVTRVDRDGQAIAALVHDPAVLDDPALVEAVAAASRLAASYARLRSDVRALTAEVQEWRRRLLEARDSERERLERRLRDGAERRLRELGRLLDDARRRDRVDPGLTAKLAASAEQLERTLADLREFARGLHPQELTAGGLAQALRSLAGESPIPVELSVGVGRLPEAVEVTLYFVCSEALANAAKYASASKVTVGVGADGGVARVEIADDGIGGADPGRGSGLRGLADRLEALGGVLRVESAPGTGTRVTAELPL